MALKGIDIASHQSWPLSSTHQTAYDESDFVIVKATQGTSYVYSNFSTICKNVLANNKLLGMYHYAGGGDAVAEANHFWETASAYDGIAIPILDFEEYQNESNWNDTNWALRFVKRYHELSSVWPLVYTSASHRSKIASCAEYCGLWVAGYPDSRKTWDIPTFNYVIDPWSTYTVWQYTSGGNLDRNTALLTVESWVKIAKGDKTVTTTDAVSLTELADKIREVAETVENLS